MLDSLHYQTFLDWLVANDVSSDFHSPPRFAIALAAGPEHESAQLGRDLSCYLNEFDERGGGAWTWFSDEITTMLSKFNHPAITHECHCSRGECPCEQQVPAIKALRQRKRLVRRFAEIGSAVLVQDQVYQFTSDLPQVFHVMLHSSDSVQINEMGKIHLSLNMDRVDPKCAVRIIADSALEWALTSVAA